MKPRLLLPLIFCAIFNGIGFAQEKSAADMVAPLLTDSTLMVVHIDLSKINLVNVIEKVKSQAYENFDNLYKDEADRRGAKNMFDLSLALAKENILPQYQKLTVDAKVSNLYFIIRCDLAMQQIPFFIAIPTDGKTEAQIKMIGTVFGDANFGPAGFPLRFARHGFFFLIPGESLEMASGNNWMMEIAKRRKEAVRVAFATLNPTPCPQIAEAFTDLKDFPVQLVVFNIDKTLEQLPIPIDTALSQIPFLQSDNEPLQDDSDSPDPFGHDNPESTKLVDRIKYEITQGIAWIAFGSDLEKQHVRFLVKSNGQQGAKRTFDTVNETIKTCVDWIFEDAKYRGGNRIAEKIKSKDDLLKATAIFVPKPTPTGDRLVLDMDEKFAKSHEAMLRNMFVQTPQIDRNATKRAHDLNNLKQIGLAVHNYHDSYNSFPSVSTADKNGKPLHSWRVALLPFLEQLSLYEQIRMNEPWDSEFNKQFHDKIPQVYVSPFVSADDTKKGLTIYATIVGKEAILEGPNTWKNMGSVADGLSNTFLFVERKKPVCWMDPSGDIPFDIAIKGINDDPQGIGNPDATVGGVNVVRCDGAVEFIPNDISLVTLKAYLTKNGGEYVSHTSYYLGNIDSRPERPKVMKPKANVQNNLKQIAIAMHTFYDVHKEFPAVSRTDSETKKPHTSWRVAILPFIGEAELYDKIRSRNEPWDSGYNKQFHNQMPEVFRGTADTVEDAQNGLTTLAVVYGTKAFFQPDKRKGMASISDGTSNTIMVVQRKTPVCWMDPSGDIPYETAVKGIDVDDKGIGAPDKPGGKLGCWVSAFDGSVHFIPSTIAPAILEALINPTDGRSVIWP